MKPTAITPSAVQSELVPELSKLHQKTGKPVSLNELPFWETLSRSEKIKLGRGFKKMVIAGEIKGVKFVGVRKDNHSTYFSTTTKNSGSILGFFRKQFG